MSTYQTISSYFVQQMLQKPDADLTSILREMCDLFHWTNATYFGTGFTGSAMGQDTLITTYKQEWIDRYFSQNYKLIDPIISEGVQSFLPLDWSDISQNSRELRKFFGEANELGVGSSGLTVAVRGLYGDSSLFSVNSVEVGQNWQSQKKEIISDLTYLAHLFHNIVVGRHAFDDDIIRPRLTRREQDVLRWAARGKTAWETATILKLSEKTVSFYISNASCKLNVASKTQAVARAISEKLIIM